MAPTKTCPGAVAGKKKKLRLPSPTIHAPARAARVVMLISRSWLAVLKHGQMGFSSSCAREGRENQLVRCRVASLCVCLRRELW